MGVALARQAVDLGAEVHLVLGPSQVPFDLSGMNVTRVESSNEMYDACTDAFKEADVTILSAAVADFKTKRRFSQKAKKEQSRFEG